MYGVGCQCFDVLTSCKIEWRSITGSIKAQLAELEQRHKETKERHRLLLQSELLLKATLAAFEATSGEKLVKATASSSDEPSGNNSDDNSQLASDNDMSFQDKVSIYFAKTMG